MSDDVVTFGEPEAPALGSMVGPWLVLQPMDCGSYGVVFRARWLLGARPLTDTTAPPGTTPCSRSSTAPKRRTTRLVLPAWFSWVSYVVAASVLAVLIVEVRHPVLVPPDSLGHWELAEERHTPPVDTPDAGVGQDVLLSVVQDPRSSSPGHVLSLPMPKAPLPGQKKPPCSPRFEREVLGVCWVVMEARPPCENEGYEYDGKCIRASFEAPRMPTSGGP